VATRRGCYPGSFNPPTVAHLAIAEAARAHAGLDHIDLVVSRRPLGKDDVTVPTFDDRIAVLEEVAGARPWLGVRVTHGVLLADLARGYDVLVVGADKWAQVLDAAWYGSADARDAAVASLPRVLVVPRPGFATDGAEVLAVDDDHAAVSSTAARNGRADLMVPEAAAFDTATGAWSDPERYRIRGAR
jgi:nicotinic acid mononucleotide adenylyltransferase